MEYLKRFYICDCIDMTIIPLVLGLIAVALLGAYYVWSRREFYKVFSKLPGPPGYPLIGIAGKLLRKESLLNLLGSYIKSYGNTFVTWLGPLPVLIVTDPEIAQEVLNSPHCVNKSFIYKSINDAVGTGLFSLPDPLWSEHRKLLNPAFSNKILMSFFPIFNEETGNLLKQFDRMVLDEEVDILPCLQHFTLSTSTQTTMGSSVKQEPSFQNNSLLDHYQWLQECVADFSVSPWLNLKFIRQILGKEQSYFSSKTEIKKFIRKLVERKLSEDLPEESPGSKYSYLNLGIDLLKRGKFNRKNVEDEANIIVFAAFETSSKAVSYTLMLLAMFPEYQERAFEEIKSLFPNAGDFSVSYDDVQQMVYLDLVLNECMRVVAPLPVVARQTSGPVKLQNGVWLPKGMQVVIDIFHMQRRKDIWGPDAETFNPENFLPHNIQEKHPYAFIPFTKGIRNCIGWRYGLLAVKVTLAKLLRNYKFSTSFSFKNLQYVENVTTKLVPMPLLKIERRN